MEPLKPPSFGELLDRLLMPPRLNELGPGQPNLPIRGELETLCVNGAFAPGLFKRNLKVVDRSMASACLAGLWLYHDFLDESHSISQQIETREGSYWHGIMHRREPDYANAKYWFRRVGEHAIGEELCQAARELAEAAPPDQPCGFLLEQSHWDHFRFVDLCQSAEVESQCELLCRQIQQREWWLLFAYCYERSCSPGMFR